MAFDSIRDMRLFVAIHQQGSISAASEVLGLTPAVASKRLKRMESQAGEALFHRSTRRLAPTAAGSALYGYALAIITTAEDARSHLTGGQEPRGFLRITCATAFGRLYLAAILSEFLDRYRQVQIDAVFTDKMLDMIDDSVDVAVRICVPLAHPHLVMRRLCSGRRLLCATPAYLAAHGHPAAPHDLKRHNCVVLNQYDVWKLVQISNNRVESIRVQGNFRSNDGEAVLDAIKKDLGIGVVALWHGGRDIESGTLVRVLDDYDLQPQPDVFAVYHPNQRNVLRIHTLAQFIEERLRLPGGVLQSTA